MSGEEILKELNIEEEVLNIYPYGSKIYGNDDYDSDSDYIIVTKGAMLANGAFRQNAISNADRTIQGILYSRSGFTDAINNYEISALECLSLEDNLVIKKKWPFKIQKWDEKEMVKKIISKASSSWYIADNDAKAGDKARAKKGIYHALRILNFGLQMKEHEKIVDFAVANNLKILFKQINDDDFDTRNYIQERDLLMSQLKS